MSSEDREERREARFSSTTGGGTTIFDNKENFPEHPREHIRFQQIPEREEKTGVKGELYLFSIQLKA